MLEVKDAMQAVAGCLTREEAAKLARLCKAGARFVRDADKDAYAGRPDVFMAGVPMWDLERTRARVAARYPESTPRDLWPQQTMASMNSLAAELVRLQEAGVVRLVFERAAALAGRPVSMFGCHKLEVRQALAFLGCMEAWFDEQRRTVASGALERFGAGFTRKASRRVLVMLQEAGLRVRGKKYRFKYRYACLCQQCVCQHEVLWHSAYWAW
jgi:hypothetical protein